jgi:hypothetical protein
MDHDCQAMLRALHDKESIRDCLYRYCRGIDRADEDALRSAYWPDARDCHGAWRGSANGFIEQALARLRTGGRGVHQITNVLIELRGDAAAVESSFLALQVNHATPRHETFLCGRYLDRFEKRNDEWRIADRTVVYDWIDERARDGLPQVEPARFGPRQPVGARMAQDPLYPFLAAIRRDFP